MADFITLTHHDGRKVRINMAQTTRYDADAKGRTRIFNTEPFNAGAGEAAFFHVTETPEQIDALLGVTDSDVIDRARFLLDRLNDLDIDQDIEGLQRDYMGHVEPAIAQLRAALAKAGASS